MVRMQRRKNLTREEKLIVAGGAVGVLLLVLMIFFFLFRVTDVKIVGNTRYEDAVMKQYVQQDILTSNTVLISCFRRHIEVDDIPFVESFDIEALDRNSIRIYVNEKQIVGYVVHETEKLFFDKDGYILESVDLTAEEILAIQNQASELEMLRVEAEREQIWGNEESPTPTPTPTLTPTPSPTEEPAEGDNGETEEDTEDGEAEEEILNPEEIQPFVADVPEILGLKMENLYLEEQIQVEEPDVFNTILGIARITAKYKIIPEIVFFDSQLNITLVYQEGTIHCELGPDRILEEKITRVAAILPHLEDKVGILHLEEYNFDTENIIFSRESKYTLKSKISTFLEKNS